MVLIEKIIPSKVTEQQPELLWLLVSIILSVIPHITRVPIWIPLLFLFLAFWCLYCASRDTTSPASFKIIISAITIVGVFLSYGTLTGRDAGVALLILLAGIKLIELRQIRDYYITVFITLLLVLTNFFYTQTILIAVYMAATMLVIVGTLISLNDRNHFLATLDRLRISGMFLLQVIPLMVILFIFFPRVPGPLWGLPKDAHTSSMGIDDEMSPGAISQLAYVDDVAFRVTFDGAIPDKASLYWRGPVLSFTDGFKWVPDRVRRPTARVVAENPSYTYTLTLEPTDKNWLYALEMPIESPKDGYFSHDLQIHTHSPVSTRTRYQLTSYTNYRHLVSNESELAASLQLPPGYHPNAVALSRSWRDQGLTDTEMVQRALRYFNKEEFYYTLTPPLLLDDPVDQFLFDTRRGFCEHYAAAFVVLMRAAGIPARVITGYQGGNINPVGNYLIVRQRDAHAWAEVWLGIEAGWVRIDPTSAVAPARVNAGIEQALPESVFQIPLGLQNNSLAREIWEQFTNTWDAINNRWNQWVLGYDEKRQSLMLEKIGLGNFGYHGLIIGLSILLLPCLILIALTILKNPGNDSDEARYYYRIFLKRLTKCGIQFNKYEGPADFAKRACRKRIDLADQIRTITSTYIEVRYGSVTNKLELLKQQVKSFHPARHTA